MFTVEYTLKALKQLKKMDKQTASIIISYIEKRLINSKDPRRYGKSLQGELSDKWRYRVGQYRILAKIEDTKLIIIIIEIGHRREIYR